MKKPEAADSAAVRAGLRTECSTVKLKRENFLLVGLLLFFVGVQFRMVESFTLTERSSRFIAAQMGDRQFQPQQQSVWPNGLSRKVVQPPRWLGLALMSVGSVLALKSLSMTRVASNSDF